jgi:hypothetical protein
MSEWKPIESAPKDGTPILAFGEGIMLVMEWYGGLEMWQASNISGWEFDAELDRPTHWQALPPPPGSET